MTEAAPPSFLIPKERFYRDGFTVDDFLGDCARRSLNMEKVLVDVNHFNGILSAQLVALINKDYAEFVRLSSSLLGSETLTESVGVSLQELSDQIVDVQKVLNGRAAEIQQSIDEIVAAQTRVATLEMFMHLQQGLEKVEALLDVGDTEALNYERLGEEFSRLDALLVRGAQHDFVKEKAARVEQAKRGLLSSLENTFRDQLLSSSRNVETLHVCLYTYSTLKRCDIPEALVRVLVVAPAVRRTVTLETIEGGKRASCDGLERVFAQLFKWASTEGVALINTLGAVSEANFLTSSIFVEMTSALKTFGKCIFATGIPDTFHRNYSLSMRWLDQMEGLFPGVEQIREFRASKPFKSWMRNWKLEVYFSLRSQEMIKHIRPVLDVGKVAPSAVFDGEFELGIFEVSWMVIDRCWNAQTYLPGLQSHTLRFTLKIFRGVLQWIKSVSERETQIEPILWLRIHRDTEITCKKMGSLVERIKTRFLSLDTHPVVDTSFEAIRNLFAQQLGRCTQAALSRLSSLSSGKLQWVRQIPTRCLAGDMPTVPSNQISTILQPMSDTFGLASKFSTKEQVKKWMRSSVADLDGHYSTITADVLQTSAKTQSYIARRAGKGSSPGPSQGMIKIVTQFTLDVDNLTKKLVDLGFVDALGKTKEVLSQFNQPEDVNRSEN